MTGSVAVKAKGWLFSKTVIVGVVAAGLALIDETELLNLIPDQYKGVALVLIPLVFTALRKISTMPLSSHPTKPQAELVERAPPNLTPPNGGG